MYIVALVGWAHLNEISDVGWISRRLGEDSENDSLYYTHALYMILCLATFIPGTLVYRAFPFLSRNTRKAVHGILTAVGVASAASGLVAVHYAKVGRQKAEFQSLHGSLGIGSLSLMFAQLFVGLVFYAPSLFGLEFPPAWLRCATIGLHRLVGSVLIVLMTVAFGTGTVAMNARLGMWAGDAERLRFACASFFLIMLGIGIASATLTRPRTDGAPSCPVLNADCATECATEEKPLLA